MTVRVLFVDDEVDLCEVFSETYRSAGVEVTALSDPLKAIDYCQKNEVDLIFLDFRMPKISGDDLAFKLPTKVPIYLITGESNLRPRFAFKGVITKPFDLSQIQAIIEKYQH